MLVKQLNNLKHLVQDMTEDSLGRPLKDLRISITDRCNFRCNYCMPPDQFSSNHEFLPRSEILSFEEITLIVKSMLSLGLKKVRITGGEPLLRKDICTLISMIRECDSNLDIALTTNGSLLSKFAEDLAKSGLDRVTVSIDAIDDKMLREISNSNVSSQEIVDGIIAAKNSGLKVKVNTVVIKDFNENQIIPLVELFYRMRVTVRFIEYMDVGGTRDWNPNQVVFGKEMRRIIERGIGTLSPVNDSQYGEVANRWCLEDGYQIGFIESISKPFCNSCTRARISANGSIYTCLFSDNGHDLKSLIKMGAESKDLTDAIAAIWGKREDRYSEIRQTITSKSKPVQMHFIGG